jgi:hypothetical protein
LAEELRIIPSFLVHEVLASHEVGMSKTYREWSPNQPSFWRFAKSSQTALKSGKLGYSAHDLLRRS